MAKKGRRCVSYPEARFADAFTVLRAGQAICACGCGEIFRPKRDWQKFARPRCRTAAYEARKQNPLLAKVMP